jgi:hypothetical protein
MILVDYTCTGCGQRTETWTPSPPVTTIGCATCGGAARRQWAPIGLSTGGAEPTRRAPATSGRPTSLCARYPQVPGICHMSASAARMWVAKYQRNNRAVDAELARQETRFKDKPPSMGDAITHQHRGPAAVRSTSDPD